MPTGTLLHHSAIHRICANRILGPDKLYAPIQLRQAHSCTLGPRGLRHALCMIGIGGDIPVRKRAYPGQIGEF